MARYRVRPSKPMSALGMIVGIVFVIIGFTVAIPNIGGFGVLWTFMAVAITIYNAINTFSDEGIAHEVVDLDEPTSDTPSLSFDDRLRRLEQLKNESLITLEEYERKRAELLAERW